jgi:hypothetical protein
MTWSSTDEALTTIRSMIKTYNEYINIKSYYKLINQYASSHKRYDPIRNKTLCWIDENINPSNGKTGYSLHHCMP